MSYPELEALRAQVKELETLLSELSAPDWERPTRCTEFTVRELVGHLGGALGRYAGLAEGEGRIETGNRYQWWGYDPKETGPLIAQRTKERIQGRSGEELAGLCISAANKLLTALEKEPDKLVGSDGFGIRAADLAAVGVLESGVHTMDLADATHRGERIADEALRFITSTLDGLLGRPLPDRLGWDARTYVLTGTGRRPLTDDERSVLGPLVDRFPLLA